MALRKLFYEPFFFFLYKDAAWKEGYTAGDCLETIKTYWLFSWDTSRALRLLPSWNCYLSEVPLQL